MSIYHRIAIHITLSLSLFLGAANFSVASEGASAIKEMAVIMHRLKHYPSPQGKETLQTIVGNKTTKKHEATLAKAMLNLEHAVASSDIAGLKSIVSNANASADEKAFATMLLNFDHRPSSADKKRLKAIMK
jgi:hypothetical protein